MRQPVSIGLGFVLGAAAAVAAIVIATHPQLVRRLLRPETPHQRYTRALAEGGLARTALAAGWLAAADRALEQPVTVETPFTQDTVLDPARGAALGYLVNVKRGQKLDVKVARPDGWSGLVFIDLFEPDAQGTAPRRPIASADEDATALSREARESGTYVVRIQPELLRGGRINVTLQAGPSLSFPVSGGGGRDVQSVFGDARDAGRRRHEGVDIFAARGTPVLAASSGFVTSVGENAIGGRVVWVWDVSRGLRFYYAHLQDQLVRPGRYVDAGDTLGTVGNTGNARTTPPHLHFGVYAGGEGAIDPAPFIRPSPARPPLSARRRSR
jgi:murein DD-endopeptidase MepM/ murein hydrolase activator NlpD